jgi:WD40 repeat protein
MRDCSVSTAKGSIPRLFLGFFKNTGAGAMLVAAIALAQGGVLWSTGVCYRPKSSLIQAYATDIAVSADGRFAAAVLRFRSDDDAQPSFGEIVFQTLDDRQTTLPCWTGRVPDCVALTPTGDAVVIGCMDNWIYVWKAAERGGASDPLKRLPPQRFARMQNGAGKLRFSPDGVFLAVSGPKETCIWKWPSGELVHQASYCQELNHSVCSFTEDSRRVLILTGCDRLSLMDLATGTEASICCPGEVLTAEVSPDGQWIAMVTASDVHVLRTDTGELLWQRSISHKSIAFVPGRGLLAVLSYEHAEYRVHILDPRHGRLLCELPSGDSGPMFLIASGGSLVYGNLGGSVLAWNTSDFSEAWQLSAKALVQDGGLRPGK